MTTLVLRLDDMKELSTAISPHVSTDGVTPVLTGVVIGGRFGNYAFASDRYTVGRFDLANILDGDAPEEDFFIPGVALKAIAAVGRTTLPNEIYYGHYRVHLEYLEVGKLHYLQARIVWNDEGEEPEMTHWMRTWLVPSSKGAFPSVHKFFERITSSPMARVVVNGAQLEKFTTYAKFKGEGMRISSTEGMDNKVASPLLIEIGRRFKALLQPMTNFSSDGFGADLLSDNATRLATEKAEFNVAAEVTE